jgi:rhamnulokinase
MTFAAAAVDLGASGGRVLLGRIGPDRLDATVVRRFANRPAMVDGRLSWDLDALWAQIVTGLRVAGPVDSVGVDSWAVDYGLLDAAGELLRPPVCYRDERTAGVLAKVRAEHGDEPLYRATGAHFQPFNTVYQLLAEEPAELARARTLLMIPDLIAHRLTGGGPPGVERTNASTTGLYDVRRGDWADELIDRLGLPRAILPPIREPGTPLGPVRSELGIAGRVTATASHDTAAAVAAVPAEGPGFAYISCGTWSLVGVELDRPVLTDTGRAANFTNEVGVDGTIRYLRNVAGLWLLQECQREWGAPLDALLAAAAAEPPLRSVVDADSGEFLAPAGMPARIAEHCRRTGQPVPHTPPAITRCVLDSLARSHARAVTDAARLSGRSVEVVHLVGGGARNALLCQLTADACGLPVLAGPAEATALGNLLVQARADGVLADSAAARALVRATHPPRLFTPQP